MLVGCSRERRRGHHHGDAVCPPHQFRRLWSKTGPQLSVTGGPTVRGRPILTMAGRVPARGEGAPASCRKSSSPQRPLGMNPNSECLRFTEVLLRTLARVGASRPAGSWPHDGPLAAYQRRVMAGLSAVRGLGPLEIVGHQRKGVKGQVGRVYQAGRDSIPGARIDGGKAR